MIRPLFAITFVLLSPIVVAAAGFDGTWTGVLRTESGTACDSSYAVKAEISGGRISGQLTSPIYSGTLTGAIAEDGTLSDLQAPGDIPFAFSGRAAGDEITGTWSAVPGGGEKCNGGFVLFLERAPARLPTAAATETETKIETEKAPAQTPATQPEDFAKGFYVQLASLKSRDRAREAWTELQKGLPDLLGGQALSLQSADLGDRGIYFRVRVGPLPNLATAEDLCWQIKAEKRDCVVVRRR